MAPRALRRGIGLALMSRMPEPRRDAHAKNPGRAAEKAKAAKRDRDLREQTKTEVEQRPYLDTEGGE